jgi:hypothetical protein
MPEAKARRLRVQPQRINMMTPRWVGHGGSKAAGWEHQSITRIEGSYNDARIVAIFEKYTNEDHRNSLF